MSLKIRRLGYALGAEITGVDITKSLDGSIVSAIRQAWLDHIVLCIPGQELKPDEFKAFAAQFGEVDDNRRAPDLQHPDNSSVGVVVNTLYTLKDKSFDGIRASMWHNDRPHTTTPAMATFLHAQKLPEIGGDTLFANVYAAYETLSPAFRKIVDSLDAVYDTSFGAFYSRLTPEVQAERRRLSPPTVHPLVRIHPETGRKALHIDATIRKFIGMTEDESQILVEYLRLHATKPELLYRHRWSVNDLVFWDNRCSLHYAVQDYDQRQIRMMIRCMTLCPQTGYRYDPDREFDAASGGTNPQTVSSIKG